MAQFASEDFAGSEGAELSAYSANWTKVTGVTGNAEIASGRLRASSTTTPAYYHSGIPASADYSVSADLYFQQAGSTSGPAAGVLGRCSTSANTHYYARYAGNVGWQLYKVVAGVATILGASVPEAVAAGSTRTIKLEMVGTSIKVYSNGVLKIDETDASITAAGRAGVRYLNTSAPGDTLGIHLDNFSADDPTSGITFNAEPGSFQIAGADATLRRDLNINAESGSFVLTGADAESVISRVMVALPATFNITGFAAELTYSGAPVVNNQAFAVSRLRGRR